MHSKRTDFVKSPYKQHAKPAFVHSLGSSELSPKVRKQKQLSPFSLEVWMKVKLVKPPTLHSNYKHASRSKSIRVCGCVFECVVTHRQFHRIWIWRCI